MMSEFDLPDTADQNEKTRLAALEFSQQYVALFVHNPVGARLLAHWDQVFMTKRTPVNAPHTEYAANEAMRAFIAGIHNEIKIAQTGAMR
jgi:hypothetical protein